ncbi:MAG: AbrB/MazE/SpoVT family DNA-binding domain-containing protein [Candidatus Doudnabacteria bacterium]|nr:AbrB/MazE/SpoVT family DNA-binding domain-containing protein [Candidatus Doudnabacteria bacterium]
MRALSELYKKDKIYGTTIVGSKGQVVIPVAARRDLRIKAGDRLVVLGKMGKALGLMRAEDLHEVVEFLLKNISKVKFGFIKRQFKKRAAEVLDLLSKN